MNKQFISGILLGFGFLFLFPACTKKEDVGPASVSLTKGLVAHYAFDGNAKDLSGNEHHASVDGAILTSGHTGEANSAYQFDGWDDKIFANSAVGLNNDNLTYAAWIKPMANPDLNSYACLISIGGQGADQTVTINNNYHSTIGVNVGGYNNTTVGSSSSIDSKQLPALNQWMHIAYTRSNSDIKMYLNGELKATISTNNALPKYNTPMLFTIGTRYNMSEGFFKGAMDEVRIYERALSAAEVQELAKQ